MYVGNVNPVVNPVANLAGFKDKNEQSSHAKVGIWDFVFIVFYCGKAMITITVLGSVFAVDQAVKRP